MNSPVLDWTNAWPGKFFPSGSGELSSAEMQKYVERLNREVPTLPFLSLPFAEELSQQIEEITPFLRQYKHMLLLGIGGSALGPRALQKSFFPQQDRPGHKGPWLWIADNVDPEGFQAYLDQLPPEETLVLVVSKSGGTVETMAQYYLVLPWLQANLGQRWKEHLLLVTDNKKGLLRAEADQHQLRTLPVPDNLGGRYSVLSAVGLVPAAFLGLNWQALLQGAMDLGRPLAADPGKLPEHPGWQMAAWAANLLDKGLNQLIFFTYIPSMAYFGAWFGQLWAESLGKEGKGSMPLPALGVTDQHSLLQMFLDGPKDKGCIFLTSPPQAGPKLQDLPPVWSWLENHSMGEILAAETLGTRMSLSSRAIPLLGLELPKADEYYAGRLMMLLECATVFCGWLIGIDPLDQPAVEEGKLLAKARLGAAGLEDEKARLKDFLDQKPKQSFF